MGMQESYGTEVNVLMNAGARIKVDYVGGVWFSRYVLFFF